MSRKTQIAGSLEVLDRIVAILVALSHLAGRVSSAPAPVRFLVLWALRRAELVARNFVRGSGYRLTVGEPGYPGSRRADAAQLAASLRRLAIMVRRLAAPLRREALLQGGGAAARGGNHCPHLRLLAASNAALSRSASCDTS